MDELLLGARLALEDLDVVDQERVEPAVALLEALRPVGAQSRDELAVKRSAVVRCTWNAGWVLLRYSAIAPRRWVLPRPGGPCRKSGL